MIFDKYEHPRIQFPQVHFMNDQELLQERNRELVFDIECLSNFFSIAFKSLTTEKVVFFEQSDYESINIQKLYWLVQNCCITGFNSSTFDIPLLWACLNGMKTERLKQVCQSLIYQTPVWKVEKEFNFKVFKSDTIDLQMIAPAAAQFTSLKHYGARMHSAILQDMPIDHRSKVTSDDIMQIRLYNINDLDITIDLRRKLDKAISLRREMGTLYASDLRSLSDAQISERVIGHEIYQTSGIEPQRPKIPSGTTYSYITPAYMKFYSSELQELLAEIQDSTFVVDNTGKIQLLKDGQYVSATNTWQIKINRSTYRLGIGGLHSANT